MSTMVESHISAANSAASGSTIAPRASRILITEDEYIVAFDLKLRLKRLGYEVVGIAACADDALLQIQDSKPDLVLMDIQLHGPIDGIDAAKLIRKENDVPIIFLTANSDKATLERAVCTQAFSYLLKPFNERELYFSIERALEQYRAARLLCEANERLEERVQQRTAELTASYTALQAEYQEHQRTFERLQTAQALARQAEQAKSQFLSTISHELLTPMNGVLGMVDMLFESSLTPHQRDHLKILQASGEDLLGILQELLDFSGMESGTLKHTPTTFDLREQLGAYLTPLIQRANKKSLQFHWHVDSQLPALVVADPMRIGQILVNLADNAIKFTDQGKIDILVHPVVSEDNRIQINFAVRDTGIGVPAAKREAIFEPFIQADGSHSRRHGGVGLGLSICDKLARMMGGAIELESSSGAGSTFCLKLWVDLPSASSLTTASL